MGTQDAAGAARASRDSRRTLAERRLANAPATTTSPSPSPSPSNSAVPSTVPNTVSTCCHNASRSLGQVTASAAQVQQAGRSRRRALGSQYPQKRHWALPTPTTAPPLAAPPPPLPTPKQRAVADPWSCVAGRWPCAGCLGGGGAAPTTHRALGHRTCPVNASTACSKPSSGLAHTVHRTALASPQATHSTRPVPL